MSSQPSVTILMSTFNGEMYLREQLDSLLAQTYPVNILVRDDGSKDKTRDILSSYAKQHRNITTYFEENIGIIPSFFKLIKLASNSTEYFALCDQDDIWEKDKIQRAIEQFTAYAPQGPALYFSELILVDETLKFLQKTQRVKRRVSFENSLTQNVAVGCTSVFNQELRNLVLAEHSTQTINFDQLRMHDWWIYQVAAAFGELIYDSDSKIKYRQHSGNAVGASASKVFKSRIKRAIKILSRREESIHKQCREFLRIYDGQLPTDKRERLDQFLNATSSTKIATRAAYASKCPVYLQDSRADILFRFMIIAGKL